MNQAQTVWWQQALSDLSIYIMMRQQGVATCHVLHYLQMTTEKVAKAYYWREGKSPPKSHAGFVQFVRFLGQIRQSSQQNRVAQLFGFQRYSDFQKCLGSFIHIAYDLERLAPLGPRRTQSRISLAARSASTGSGSVPVSNLGQTVSRPRSAIDALPGDCRQTVPGLRRDLREIPDLKTTT